MNQATAKRLLFVSTHDRWAGCEELWSATAAELARQGHSVTAFRANLDSGADRFEALRKLGCVTIDALDAPFVGGGAIRSLGRYSPAAPLLSARFALDRALKQAKPDLVLVSQALNIGGLHLLSRVRRSGAPYVIVCHQAGEMYWPPDDNLAELRACYSGAEFAAFVSEHNRRLTEEQLGLPIPDAVIVRNPVRAVAPLDWPGEDVIRMACPARLYVPEKGQDILLRVLTRPKWRERPIRLSLFGDGENRRGLEAMAAALRLDNVSFPGFEPDLSAIWRDHHALALSSRVEGLPMALVEAMLAGRVPIVTAVGGSGEVVTDGATGFVAAAPTDDSFDDALERAWSKRAEWRSIGNSAKAHIHALVPERPELELASMILRAASRS